MHVSVNILVLHVCWQAVRTHLEIHNKIQETSHAILYEGQHLNLFNEYPPSPRICVSPGNLAAAATNREEFLRTLEL